MVSTTEHNVTEGDSVTTTTTTTTRTTTTSTSTEAHVIGSTIQDEMTIGREGVEVVVSADDTTVNIVEGAVFLYE